jgi:hypothetical protein
MRWLNIAEARHEYDLARVRSDAEFSNYRRDPRIASLISRLP